MSNINTELNEAVSKGTNLSDAWNELMRKELEHAINELLQSELTSFLDYEKWDIAGYNSGNSRNGSYAREIVTRFGKISIEVPRDRNGDFQQHTVPKYRRSDGSLEEMVIQMYTKGITTSEISDLIEKMYGNYYTPATISNMTKATEELVKEFHSRSLSSRYSVIYGDTAEPERHRGDRHDGARCNSHYYRRNCHYLSRNVDSCSAAGNRPDDRRQQCRFQRQIQE